MSAFAGMANGPEDQSLPIYVRLPTARVTVIIPTYNRPVFLRRALSSVLAQTYRDFAILVWNDGGEDAAATVVSSFVDERITYYRSDVNEGCMRAAVSAWSVAQSDYIAHLDDDDEWAPEFLSTLVPLLEANPGLALAFCDHWMMNEASVIDTGASDRNSQRWGRSALRAGHHQPAVDLAVRGVIPTTRAAVVRRLAIACLAPPAGAREAPDRWLAFAATRDGSGVVYVPGRLALARRHAGQTTKRVASVDALESEVRLTRAFLADPSTRSVVVELRSRLAATTANWSIVLLSDNRGFDARVAAQQAIVLAVTWRTVSACLATKLPFWLSAPAAHVLRGALGDWRMVLDLARKRFGGTRSAGERTLSDVPNGFRQQGGQE